MAPATKSAKVLACQLLERLEDGDELGWKDLCEAVSDLCCLDPADVERVLRAHQAIVNESGGIDPDCELPNWADNLDSDWKKWSRGLSS